MSTTWTAGVVKHGSDPVAPSPGSVARVALTTLDESGEVVDTCTRDWQGYTAADALAEKRAIFKGNDSPHTYRDGVLTRLGLPEGHRDVYTAEDVT